MAILTFSFFGKRYGKFRIVKNFWLYTLKWIFSFASLACIFCYV